MRVLVTVLTVSPPLRSATPNPALIPLASLPLPQSVSAVNASSKSQRMLLLEHALLLSHHLLIAVVPCLDPAAVRAAAARPLGAGSAALISPAP
eukprot:CAMPEP_0174894758 /NCGR_PEP_ID=MMETSP0167-20121228/9317_1 /TAXON_ID=38298 /ORGANISM="Rhodella maculata, Strain CCMP736" /LENGTH=93 /DNA_ID=CAMNT_0016133917 /DNA_START=20 /DNA_END=297 /DNA_ORIENTATION=-